LSREAIVEVAVYIFIPESVPSLAISALEIGTKTIVNTKASIEVTIIFFMTASFRVSGEPIGESASPTLVSQQSSVSLSGAKWKHFDGVLHGQYQKRSHLG
jgi:hypothetical protein